MRLRLDWFTVRTRGLAALLAVVIVGFCLAASGHDAGGAGACPTGDGAPRFCAQPGFASHALIVVASVVPVAAQPEPGIWVAVPPAKDPDRQRPVPRAAPRAPPALSL